MRMLLGIPNGNHPSRSIHLQLAGSGKTSVIAAKAAYLVKAGIRKPEEILLLAFA